MSTQPLARAQGRGKRASPAELREVKSGQTLAIFHDDELVAYQLDEGGPDRPEGEKMADGVLIGQHRERSIVCFVELKSTFKDKESPGDRVQRALAQLESTVRHFHPAATSPRSHGDEHHERWRQGDDRLEVMPSPEHEVLALAVAYRAVPRRPPEPPRWVGKTKVYFAVVQLSPAHMNRVEKSFADLLRAAGRG